MFGFFLRLFKECPGRKREKKNLRKKKQGKIPDKKTEEKQDYESTDRKQVQCEEKI